MDSIKNAYMAPFNAEAAQKASPGMIAAVYGATAAVLAMILAK